MVSKASAFTNLGSLTSMDRDLDKIAIIDLGTGEERRFSYGDFEAQANAVARALTARGLVANLKERTMRLESKVNGRFHP